MKKFRLDEDILQNACQRVQDNRQQRSLQESNAQILSEVERLHAALLLLQDQHSKLFQMLQNGSQQSWMEEQSFALSSYADCLIVF